ncbi:MAG: L-threonylcarbamoyladenylate synthase [Candidatus Dojkabacteria bacterium]
MEILPIANTDKVIQKAVEVLESGGLVIFPTETSYGMAADAQNPEAVSNLLEYKQRPAGKAISIAVKSKEMAAQFIEVNETADKIINNFLPGPVTVVSKSLHNIDKRLEAENGTLGIRIPNFKLVLDLIEAYGKPITSTSANVGGGKTPYSVSDILDDLSENKKSLINLILDAGTLPKNPPSTVIDTTTDDLKVYRQGRIDPTQMKVYESQITNSVEETIKFGEDFIHKIQLATHNSKPVTILLNGELGAGKTHFTKGIGKGLGVNQIIKSPTYTYVSEYSIRDSNPQLSTNNSKLYHFDAWRVQSKQDLEALRFYDWFKEGNTIVVEWPSVIMALDENFFKNIQYFYIDFVILDGEKRQIKIYKNNK